jgi:hypothetical protein
MGESASDCPVIILVHNIVMAFANMQQKVSILDCAGFKNAIL